MIEKKITVCVGTDRSKHFAVRLSLMLVDDDGRVISEQYHRINIAPGADLATIRALNEAHLADPQGSVPGSPWPAIPDDEWAEVEAMIGIVHKPAVVAAYQAQRAAQAEEQRLADEERLAESKAGLEQAGRTSIGALAVLVAVALSGCAAATAYVQQHAAGLAATALVAGTAAQVSGALINADELERRMEQRAAPDENKAKR